MFQRYQKRKLDLVETVEADYITTEEVRSDLVPDVTNTRSLGSTLLRWIGWFTTLTVTTLTTGTTTLAGDITPDANNTRSFGTTSFRLQNLWSNLLNGINVPTTGTEFLTTTGTQTASGKTLSAPTIVSPTISGHIAISSDGATNIGTATNRLGYVHLFGYIFYYSNILMNLVYSTFTFSVLAYPDVLTASNQVRIPTDSANATEYVVLRDMIQTLTNKVLTGNTLLNWINGLGNTITPEVATGTVLVVSTTTASFAPDQGPITTLSSANQTWKLTKYSDGLVRCQVPALGNIAQSAVATFHSGTTTIPSGYRPTSASDASGYEFIINDNGYKKGGFSVRSNGEVYIGTNVTVGNFANAGNVGWPSQAVWWGTT